MGAYTGFTSILFPPFMYVLTKELLEAEQEIFMKIFPVKHILTEQLSHMQDNKFPPSILHDYVECY